MSADTVRPAAVLVGADDVRGQYLVRTLSQWGIEVVGVMNDRWSPSGWSRRYDDIVTADTSSDDLIDTLEELGRRRGDRPVLIPCFDTTVVLVARHRDRLDPLFRILQPDPDVVELLIDKVAFYRYAQEHDLPIPPTRFLTSIEDVEAAADELHFPLIVKPPASKHPRWQQRTDKKAIRVESQTDLESVYAAFADAVDGPLIVQEWIPGGDDHLFACHGSFDADGNMVASFTSRKIRQWPNGTGEVCLAEDVRCDAARDIAASLFTTVGYRGIGYVEVKQHAETGEYFLIEPNVRVSGRAGIAEAGGVQLAYSMYAAALGEQIDAGSQKYTGVRWVFWRKDAQSALHMVRRGELSIVGWLRSLRKVRIAGLFSWTDPGPFVGDLVRGVRLMSSQNERKRRSTNTG